MSESVERSLSVVERVARTKFAKNVLGVCFARRFEHGRRSSEQQRTFAPHRRYSAADVRVAAAGIKSSYEI